MNRVNQIFSALFATRQSISVSTAQSLLERANHARGQSCHEADQLRANAKLILSVLR
jgi:hypothetical protein